MISFDTIIIFIMKFNYYRIIIFKAIHYPYFFIIVINNFISFDLKHYYDSMYY